MLLRRGLAWLATKARNVLLKVLAAGPIPQHIAFVMDGNRRYARMNGKAVHQGHADGYITLRRVSSEVKGATCTNGLSSTDPGSLSETQRSMCICICIFNRELQKV
jgi:hypothetical protein